MDGGITHNYLDENNESLLAPKMLTLLANGEVIMKPGGIQ
jgi:hypothetical protein